MKMIIFYNLEKNAVKEIENFIKSRESNASFFSSGSLAEVNKVIEKDKLFKKLYGHKIYPTTKKALDMHIRRLKKKIAPEIAEKIQTIEGIGYKYYNP